MSNVPSTVARQGWEFYRAAVPPPTHEEVNARLRERGLPGVSPRTYRHYRRMQRCHEVAYLPINELDQKWKGRG
jgi:hypothetical protein